MQQPDRVAIIAKVERAKEHIHRLAAEIRAFWNSNPYAITSQDDPQTGDEVFRIHGNFAQTLRWSVIIGEIMHDLRSSLDHLAWQLVVANGARPGRNTQFPMTEDSKDYALKVERMINGASDEAVRIAKSLKLYKGGSDLYFVHALNNIDKHRLLITAGLYVIRAGGDPEPFFLEDGAEVYRIPAANRKVLWVNIDPKFAIDVALHEPGIIEREPLILCLLRLADLTQEVISVFYANCRELH